MAEPMVSVLMSVYDGERYLRDSVESMLNQTFADFEFVIVNDSSTDASRAILESYDDSRILLLHNQKNRGLTYSLNRGLAAAKSEYVARMDADDISVPQRLEKQVSFLRAHPEIGILGCSCDNIDSEGRRVGSSTMPETDLAVRWVSLLGNPFIHSTVMIRRGILVSNGLKYDETFETAQDYDLWTRMLQHTRGANLGERLIRYRLCDNVTRKQRKSQLQNHDIIAVRTIREQLPDFIVNPERISELGRLFIGGDYSTREVAGKRVALANLYLNMFEKFMDRCDSEPSGRRLKRDVAARAARIIFHRPLQQGWMTTLMRLAILEPTFALPFFPNLSKK
ncbi:MAG: glycosyltransferase [Deltaproteobacteria bacterium]|nr:glycosyltransferase [Deltaproteobacteria bacterium]